MAFGFYRFTTKNKQNVLLIFLFLKILSNQGGVLGADITVGTAVVTNECSSLGSNNPLRLKDCSIFKLKKGMSCMLTITKTETIEVDGVQSMVESYRTACIILEKMDAATRKKITNEFNKKLEGDVLVECHQNYVSILNVYILLLATLFFYNCI